jgi:hypothetical protein
MLAILLAALVAISIIGAVRLLPALEDARELRSQLLSLGRRVATAGMDIDRSTVAEIRADIGDARVRLQRLDGLLTDDAFVGALRSLPPARPHVEGASALVRATADLIEVGEVGARIGDRYVAVREVATGGGGQDVLADLVSVMAESASDVDAVLAHLRSARAALDTMPSGLAQPLEIARAELVDRLDQYQPVVEGYARADDAVPRIMGVEGRRRYLVLAQDPAELRPTGGFVGTYGIVTVDRGRLVSHEFDDVYHLDLLPGQPYREPPGPLKDHLLGRFSWQLADANWSPDFPTAANDIVRIYEAESGDGAIDGVIALTTFAIDHVLEATGPVDVRDYDVEVASGETTLTSLVKTRRSQRPGENRKEFLGAFADELIKEVLALRPREWPKLSSALSAAIAERQISVWFRDGDLQSWARGSGVAGAMEDRPGDLVYVVGANVAPVGKLDLVVRRSLRLDVRIDPVGNAHHALTITWDNPIRTGTGRTFDELRKVQAGREILGEFVRVYVPMRSRLEAVEGGSAPTPIESAETVGEEVGRAVFGNYLMVPPGRTDLTYRWVSPYAAELDAESGRYTLRIPKQAGVREHEVTVRVTAPPTYVVTQASLPATTSAAEILVATTASTDVELALTFARAP